MDKIKNYQETPHHYIDKAMWDKGTYTASAGTWITTDSAALTWAPIINTGDTTLTWTDNTSLKFVNLSWNTVGNLSFMTPDVEIFIEKKTTKKITFLVKGITNKKRIYTINENTIKHTTTPKADTYSIKNNEIFLIFSNTDISVIFGPNISKKTLKIFSLLLLKFGNTVVKTYIPKEDQKWIKKSQIINKQIKKLLGFTCLKVLC